MADYKVGGKVICVKDHSQGVVQKGKIYDVLGFNKSKCKCAVLLLDIGIPVKYNTVTFNCIVCSVEYRMNMQTHWLDSRLFLPLDDFKEVTFTEIKKEVPVSAQ